MGSLITQPAHLVTMAGDLRRQAKSVAEPELAAKLHATAMFLKTPIGFFFEGLDDPEGADTTAADLANEMAEFWSQPGGPELARSYVAIPSTGMRKHLVDLAKAIAGEE